MQVNITHKNFYFSHLEIKERKYFTEAKKIKSRYSVNLTIQLGFPLLFSGTGEKQAQMTKKKH